MKAGSEICAYFTVAGSVPDFCAVMTWSLQTGAISMAPVPSRSSTWLLPLG